MSARDDYPALAVAEELLTWRENRISGEYTAALDEIDRLRLKPGQHVVQHAARATHGELILTDFEPVPVVACRGWDYMRWVVVASGPALSVTETGRQ